MIPRRVFFGLAGLTQAVWLRAQDSSRHVVVLKVAVTDRQGRYINSLKLSDFRVFEDGILQTVSTFAKPPLLMNDEGARPLPGGKISDAGKLGAEQETFESIREDLHNSYTIIYHPDPSKHNEGFRRINIEIVPDIERRWRVRHRPGYRPRLEFKKG